VTELTINTDDPQPTLSDNVDSFILEHLTSYQMLPQLIKELIMDTVIETSACPEPDIQDILKDFCLAQCITSEKTKQTWLQYHRMGPQQMEQQAIRQWRIEQYKKQRWASQVETMFLAQKGKFEQVVYSLLRTKSHEIAQELFFRLQEEEQTFAELATEYSQGSEALTDGLVGPVEIGRLHPALSQLLQNQQTGKLYPPTQFEQWVIILRLEKSIPASLTDTLRQRLIEQQYQEWLQQEIAKFDFIPFIKQLFINGNVPNR
jgi:PPIC-type PPIASE domain